MNSSNKRTRLKFFFLCTSNLSSGDSLFGLVFRYTYRYKLAALLKKFIDYLVYGNLLIGMGAFGMSQFFIHLNSEPNFYSLEIGLFLFAATTFTYNFHRRMGYALKPNSIPSDTTKWMLQHPFSSKLISIISLIVALYYLMELPKLSLLIILPVSLISLLYVQRLSEGKVLREIPLLKIFLISIVWSMVAVLLPAVISSSWNLSTLIISIGFLFFMIAEIIPFDIRDMLGDRLDGLKTIPLLLKERKSKSLAAILLALSNLLIIPTLLHNNNWIPASSFLISSTYLAIAILKVKEFRKDYYYSLFIELSLLLPYLLNKLLGLLFN